MKSLARLVCFYLQIWCIKVIGPLSLFEEGHGSGVHQIALGLFRNFTSEQKKNFNTRHFDFGCLVYYLMETAKE